MLQPQRASVAGATFPAPIKGVNSITALSLMGPEYCIYSKNIDASIYGMKVRPGFVQFGDDYTGDQIKTIIPYMGSVEAGTADYLFATDSDGIWDASSVPTTPTKDYTWATSTTDPAGWAQWDIFTNDSGTRVLLVCDEANGLVQYNETTWSVPTVTGVSAADLVQLTTWKNRVWYVEKDSSSGWYSAAGTYSGALTEFNFGSKFSKGGYLKAIYNWTRDSGDGPDDYLVALSSAGDVVVYQGTDPSSSATFSIVGVFDVGEFPKGRRVGSDFGGDLILLSSYGVIRCSDLISGVNPFTFQGSLSYNINGSLRPLLKDNLSSRGWEIKQVPDLAKIIINTPKIANQPYTQYVYDINAEAWSVWTGVPYVTGDTYKQEFYCGASTSIYKLTGDRDDLTTLTTADAQPIEWSFLTGYSDLETPQMNKVVEMIRPRFISEGSPATRTRAFYDYDLQQIAAAIGSPTQPGDVWDTGLWDQAVWGGGVSPNILLKGSSGMGRKVAVAVSGTSTFSCTLMDLGVLYKNSVNSLGLL